MRRPLTVLGTIAVVTALALPASRGITLSLDGRSLIPPRHPAMDDSDAAAVRFGLTDAIVVAVHSERGSVFTPLGLSVLARMSDGLAALEGVDAREVASLATVPRLVVVDGVLDLRPLLSSDSTPTAALCEQLRHETAVLGLDDGVLLSRDGRSAAIYAPVSADANRRALGEQVAGLIARQARDGITLAASGSALAQAALGSAAAADLARLVPAVLLVMGGVITLAFRHPLPAVICLLEVGLSLVWTAGVMGFRGEAVFVTTLALPVILVVIGVSDDLYVLSRFARAAGSASQMPPSRLAYDAVAPLTGPVGLTAATTVIGLLSLLGTGLEPQRVFGLYGAVSVAISTLFTFTLVPALLSIFGGRLRRVRGGGAVVQAATDVFRRHVAGRGSLLRFAAIAGAGTVVAALIFPPRIDDSWVRNLAYDSPIARGDRQITEWLAGTNTLEFSIDSGSRGGFQDPRALQLLANIESALVAHPSVGAVQSAYGEILRVLATLSERPRDQVRREIVAVGLSRTDAAQALMLLDSLKHSPMPDWLDEESRHARLRVFLRSASYVKVDEVSQLVRTATDNADGVVAFGDAWIGRTTIALLVRGQIAAIWVAIAGNLLLLSVLFRSVALAAIAIAPVIAGTLVIYGWLGLAGIPLGTANSMFAAVALGVGGDYAIHLTAACRSRISDSMAVTDAALEALRDTGPAVLTSAVALPSGFLVLLGSAVPPNRELGLLVAVSVALSALLALVIVPSLAVVAGRGWRSREAPRRAAV